MKTLSQIREASGGKEAYQKFFNSLLKKFGVSSPSELEGKKKKDFFDAIDKGWDGDNEPAESVKEGKKLKGGKGKAELDINWDGSAKDVKFAATKYKIKIKPHRDGAMISGDKQKILAFLQGQDYAMDDEDIEDLYPEVLETYDDPDNLDPETDHNPDEAPFAKKKGKGPHDGKTESRDFSQAQEVTEKDTLAERGKEAKLSSAQLKKAEKIAKKHSGDMERAMAEIEKIKKGSSESDAVMAMLKKHNEATIHISNEITEKVKAGKGKDSVGTDVDWDNVGDEKKWIKQAKSKYKVTIKKDVGKYHSGAEISGKKADIIKFLQGPMYGGVDDRDIEDMWPSLVEAVDCDGRLLGFKAATRRAEGQKQKGRVIVDRRTRGYREAKLRSEKYRLKQEAKRKAEEFAKRYPKIDYAEASREEMDETMKKIQKNFELPETAANAVASGGVDMAPNAGKKKKDKFKVVKHANY